MRSPTTSRPQPSPRSCATYQLEGFRWLATLWDLGLGGILADDMGLGKTVQVARDDLHARERDPDAGPVPRRRADQRRAGLGRPKPPASHPSCGSPRSPTPCGARAARSTTSSTPTSSSPPTPSAAWRPRPGDRAVGRLRSTKRSSSRTTSPRRTAAYASLSAPFKLAITGTPMENNLMELWSLLSITAPGLFPTPPGSASSTPARSRARAIPSGWPACAGGSSRWSSAGPRSSVAADLPAKQEQILDVELAPAPPQALRHPPAARAPEDPRPA